MMAAKNVFTRSIIINKHKKVEKLMINEVSVVNDSHKELIIYVNMAETNPKISFFIKLVPNLEQIAAPIG